MSKLQIQAVRKPFYEIESKQTSKLQKIAQGAGEYKE